MQKKRFGDIMCKSALIYLSALRSVPVRLVEFSKRGLKVLSCSQVLLLFVYSSCFLYLSIYVKNWLICNSFSLHYSSFSLVDVYEF